MPDQDRLANRETPSVLSILVIEDIAMAIADRLFVRPRPVAP